MNSSSINHDHTTSHHISTAWRWAAIILGMALLGLVPISAFSDRTEAVTLVEEAQQLIEQVKYEEARATLQAALKADPAYAETYATLGHLHELCSEVEQAVDSYGHTLELAPNHSFAQTRMHHLFYEAHFPRWLQLDYLKFSPISAVVDTCQTRLPNQDRSGAVVRHDFAYTTSLIFPEEMGRTDPAVKVRIPSTGGDSPIYATINRVCYGLVKRPNSQRLDLRFVVQYPSRTISQSDNDYSKLAQTITHLLLRFSSYATAYLNRPPIGDEEGLVHVYLCEMGPAGAELYRDNIYFYDIGQPRTAAEWAREVAHELGHYLLPATGEFDEPEKLANGRLGERLFLQWLVAEAELVTEKPWPADETVQALQPVIAGDAAKMVDFVDDQCRSALDLWLREGPDSPLLEARSAQAMDYFTGSCLWVLAAHGPGMLAEVFDNTPGENPQPADVLAAYQQIVADHLGQQPLQISAGALDLEQSTLSASPREGPVRREEISLAAGDSVAIPVYLPAGMWQVSCRTDPSSASVALQITLEGKTLISPDHLTISTQVPGWHTIRISSAEASANVQLQGIKIEQAPQA